MSINSRIAELIKYLGDTENSFSKRIGASSSAIFNIVNSKGRMSYPSGLVLEKILQLDKEGRVSAEWLMRGEGLMILTQEESYGHLSDSHLVKRVKRLEEDVKFLLNRSTKN
jgi:hypothetical protein